LRDFHLLLFDDGTITHLIRRREKTESANSANMFCLFKAAAQK